MTDELLLEENKLLCAALKKQERKIERLRGALQGAEDEIETLRTKLAAASAAGDKK